MKKIKVERLTQYQKEDLKIPDAPKKGGPWAVWECGPSAFHWHYDDTELAYIYEGRVKVITDKEHVDLKAGDFVTFPKGLDCRWEVFEKVRKVYKFE
jgi:uncharacterized cupin superfamily protein